MKSLLKKLQQNTHIILACAIVAMVCGLFASIMVNKGLAPSEGWYSYYAYCVNKNGAVPYKDLDLCFPPLYLNIISFLTSIFGYNLIALRIVGVFIFILTGVFACLILNKIFKNSFIATIGSLIFVAFLQSETAQLFYDYIRFMDVCVVISIYFMLRFFSNLPKYSKFKLDANLIISSCFATFAALFKQSSGLVFYLFGLMFILVSLFFVKNKKVLAFHLAIYFGVFLLINSIMFVILAIQGALKNYFYFNFLASTGAKGGVKSILFSNLIRTLKYSLIEIPIAFVLVLILFAFYFNKHKQKNNVQINSKLKIILLSALGVLSIILLILCFVPSVNRNLLKTEVISFNDIMQLAFIFSAFAFAAIVINFIVKFKRIDENKKSLHLTFIYAFGCSFALNYAAMMSAGLCRSQAALSLALMCCSVLSMFKNNDINVFILCALLSFFPSALFSTKISNMYSWWGLEIGSYWQQTKKIDNNSIFDGIYVNKTYYEMYSDILAISKQEVGEGDTTFFFPHIPILYLYTNTTHSTHTSLQWPDVSLDKAVKDDIDILKQNPPKLIVMCDLPDFVTSGHERLFRDGEYCGMHYMLNFLHEFVVDNNYTFLKSYEIASGYYVSCYLLP